MKKEDCLMEQIDKEIIKKGKKKTTPRPYLFSRFGAGIIDVLLIIIVAFALELLIQITLFKPLGYYKYLDTAHTILEESKLYQKNGNSFEKIEYNADTYEMVITNYYSTNEDAIEYEKMQQYTQSKIDSGLFKLNENNQYVLKNDNKDSDVQQFYINQYEKALDFLNDTPEYVTSSKKSFYILLFSLLISSLISSTIFYMIIPLCRKEGETIGQIIFKICLLSKDNTTVKKSQIVLRAVVLIVINVCLPFILYIKLSYGAFIPLFATMFMICFTKTNSGPHDYLSSTYVINKKRTDGFEILKAMNGEK